jgi:phospholipase C
MNGWSLQNPGAPTDAGNPVGCMGYYAADDIPYHWRLAQNFALCDNYFCSHMGVTEPNRLYLISGRIDNSSEELLNNPSTPTGQNAMPAALRRNG